MDAIITRVEIIVYFKCPVCGYEDNCDREDSEFEVRCGECNSEILIITDTD